MGITASTCSEITWVPIWVSTDWSPWPGIYLILDGDPVLFCQGIQLLTDSGGDLVQGRVVHLLYNGHGIFPAVCVSSLCIFSGPAGFLLFCLL